MPRTLKPLILSGGPAVGKSTCGRALAAEQDRAAFIDVDDIRQLIVSGGEALWRGAEGEAQAELAALNTSALATNLIRAGFAVVVADFITPATIIVYRRELPQAVIVHLAISLEAARARAATRTVHITDDEFALLHETIATPPDADVILHVDGLTAAEQLRAIRDSWLASGSLL